MSHALHDQEISGTSTNQKPQKKTTSQQAVQIDIAVIGAAPFQQHLKKKDTEVFITSLSEIDHIIEERRAEDCQREDSHEQELVQQLLSKQYQGYADVFSKAASDELPPRRANDYQIELDEGKSAESAVGYSPLYKQTAEELEAARNYIVDNLSKGFIGPSAAPFASPILMAQKPGGGLRFCVDYQKLNAITRKDRYPIPLVDELMERISTFQRFINDTLMDYLDEFVTAFVDDLLIYSKNTVEHELHVKKVLERLRAAGLQASIKKCEFHVTQTKYLGFILTTDGIEVDPEKTAVIQNWAVPTTVWGVQHENTLADALSRPNTEVQKKDEYHQQILIKLDSIEQPLETKETGSTIGALEPTLHIVDQVLKANRDSAAEEYREKAQQGVDGWILQEGLLLKGDQLFVPDDDPELQTQLLDEVHAQVSTAHPGRTKTQQLIKNQYYWPTWRQDIERYTEIMNQHIVNRLRPFINRYQDNWSELLPLIDFAAAALPSESTDASPFLIDCGYEPRTSFDWTPIGENLPREERISRQRAQEAVKRMEETWMVQADHRCRPVDFNVGDKVWLSLRHYHMDRPNKKLDSQMAGPFLILEKVVEPPEPIVVGDEQEWEVEEVLASHLYQCQLQYQVKWIGFDEDQTWYPAANFKGSPHRIRDYHQEHPDRPGPPRRLQEWLKAWEEGVDEIEDHPDDNTPA
ncbi:hypothetical protein SI65_07858 [Aspergillus cristatus]|uniref:Chromo domain-containing protein n=1 Tax=Aspergillus cristatus TaxID=573508 RepID=A0A1E3B7F6_ASPCR|nr:hypothetical protein SI65_07858 [Aspergillus cristatus]